MSKRRWCKFSKERGKYDEDRSTSESEEEDIPVKPDISRKLKSSTYSEHHNSNAVIKDIRYDSKLKKGSSKSEMSCERSTPNCKQKSNKNSSDEGNSPALPSIHNEDFDDKPSSSSEKGSKKIYDNSFIGPSTPSQPKNVQELNQNIIGPFLPPSLSVDAKMEENIDAGPVVLPHLLQNSAEAELEPSEPDVVGPALPPHLLKKFDISPKAGMIGPEIPAHLVKENETSDDVAGPSLPPHLLASSSRKVIGPELPPGFVAPDSSSDEEVDTVGPNPRLMAAGYSSAAMDVDERAARAKRKMLGLDQDGKKERESWMLELPPEKASIIGLGPRQFRQKLAPEMGDRSVWTDTPSDTARKQGLPPKLDDKAIVKQKEIAERDRMMDKLAKKAEKKLKRKESLLAMHTSKLNKKAKKEAKEKEGQPVERKRFNREEDMQVHRFDEAQKKAIFKRAQLLNDRFSQGESKYL